MARKLFVVEDDLMKSLPDVTKNKMKAELVEIYKFVPRFTSVIALPKNFPEQIDFTDSIVKVVESDEKVTAAANRAKQQQVRSLNSELHKLKLRLTIPDIAREAAVSERGGVGWQSKSIAAAAGRSIKLVQTGGIVALDYVKEEVMTDTAPNGWTVDEAKRRSNKLRTQAQLSHGEDEQKKKLREADEVLRKSQAHWALQAKPIKDWPQNLQEAAGVALARAIAHEARHQYVIGHWDEGGLGGESADIHGFDKHARIHPEDQKAIIGALTRFEALQGQAGLHLKTLPSDQPFAFS